VRITKGPIRASARIEFRYCFGAVWGSSVLAQSPITFTQPGNLTIPRQFHPATLPPTGEVLIAGGVGAFAEI
jgi:hypothetical protein